ncbi:sugar transferase [Mucilaginibacter sabulilitoris]|uniref:Sugar transferase n=1 Tax=Mucilaginibacter sabulilitoris TaxID=1173583 RepID=A0ABZ0TT93_9SPHI|nr:sugar transferase [Mucilaginibacter sabulilitoris]WPU95692.1 sugar transferase [Mucilaginibacter sabulilitoris]
MSFAPIILFTYKRVAPLKATIAALQQNFLAPDSLLYIFSDGPRNESDKMLVDEVRDYLQGVSGFKSVTIREAAENKGLARSIIEGTSELIQQFGKVIVLEDDLLTTPNFLDFMNNALNVYADHPQVFSISGYSFHLKPKSSGNPPEAYFLNRGWSWGWATWADRWVNVDWQMKEYDQFKNDNQARKQFAKGGSDLNSMLDKQMTGQLDSWAIRWFFNQYKQNGLTLYPRLSKIYNNGFDQFATHTNGSSSRYIPSLDTQHLTNFILPGLPVLNNHYQKQFQRKMGIASRIKSKIETLFIRYFK